MAEANSINAATTGIVGNTGTAFTGTAVTNHSVIVGGSTSSTLTNVAPSTAGFVLTSNGASADPSFQTPLVGSVLFIASLTTTATAVTGDATVYTIICDTVVKNVGSGYNNGTGAFTAPIAGTYFLNAVVTLGGLTSTNTTSYTQFNINAGPGNYVVGEDINGGVVRDQDSNFQYNFSGPVVLAHNDVVTLIVSVWNNATKNVSVVGHSLGVDNTYISGYLIG